jgi:dTMP kinase
MKKGLFITVEGTEGSGKSTQTRRLYEYLVRQRYPVTYTREPGGTSIAEAVRRVLLNPASRIEPMTELFLYEAARAQHIAEVIGPTLKRGGIVLCERFTDATEAYQGRGRGLPLATIRELNRAATGGLKPDLTLWLDAPVGQGVQRARALGKRLSAAGGLARGGDRLERESLAFHRRVRAGYRALARREPNRIRVVPWRHGIEAVQALVLDEVKAFLKRRWR